MRKLLVPAAATVTLMASMLVAVPSAQAAKAFDPGDFTVEMTGGMDGGGQGGGGPVTGIPCTDPTGEDVDLIAYVNGLMSGDGGAGTAELDCEVAMTMAAAGVTMSGTVTNREAGSGDISMVCDMQNTMGATFTMVVAATGVGMPSIGPKDGTSFRMTMKGFQACTWSMTFPNSKLSGSIEQTVSFDSGNKDAEADCPAEYASIATYCTVATSTARIFIVGGTGVFADMSGDGGFTETRVIPIPVPSMGGGGTITRQQCEAMGGTWNGSSCVRPTPSPRAALARAFSEVRAAATSESPSMSMKLTKTGPSVRLVSPRLVKSGSASKRVLGSAPGGGKLLTVKAVAAPGSECAVSGQGTGKPVVLQKAGKTESGLITTSITSATLKDKLSLKKNDRATIAVTCTLGSGKKAKSFQASAQVVIG